MLCLPLLPTPLRLQGHYFGSAGCAPGAADSILLCLPLLILAMASPRVIDVHKKSHLLKLYFFHCSVCLFLPAVAGK